MARFARLIAVTVMLIGVGCAAATTAQRAATPVGAVNAVPAGEAAAVSASPAAVPDAQFAGDGPVRLVRVIDGLVDPVTVANAGDGRWTAMEGADCFRGSNPQSEHVGIDPAGADRHGEAGCAVAGIRVFHDRSNPRLNGSYVVSDFCSDTLWGMSGAATGTRVQHELIAAPLRPTGGSAGEADELCLTLMGILIPSSPGRRGSSR